MAKAVVLVVLLALAAATADARLIHRFNRGRSLAGAGAGAVSICEHATFPKLCRALIPSLSHPITSGSLTAAAINATEIKGQEAKVAASRFMADRKTPQPVKEALAVCYQNFDTALVSLGDAAKLVKQAPKTHDLVMARLQNALSYVGNCEDTFSQLSGQVSPIAHITSHLEKLTSNSLSLALGAY